MRGHLCRVSRPVRQTVSFSKQRTVVRDAHLGALTATAIAQTTKDLTRFPGAEFKRRGSLRLQTRDGASELQHRLRLVHDLALKDQVLEPVVRCFDLTGHVRQLETDDRVIDEFFAKGAALVGVFDGFFIADAGEAEALDDDPDPLVVEIGHDDCGGG